MTARHAYSCDRCAEWVFVDVAEGERRPDLRAAACPVCETNRTLAWRGVVESDKVIDEYRRVPCDDRCTTARARSVTAGAVGRLTAPTVSAPCARSSEVPAIEASASRAMRNVRKLRTLLDELDAAIVAALEARYRRPLELRCSGAYLPPAEWQRLREWTATMAEVRHVRRYKRPATRLEGLREIAGRLGVELQQSEAPPAVPVDPIVAGEQLALAV